MRLLSAKSGTGSLRDDSTVNFSAIVPQNSASNSFPVYAWTKLQEEGLFSETRPNEPGTGNWLKPRGAGAGTGPQRLKGGESGVGNVVEVGGGVEPLRVGCT